MAADEAMAEGEPEEYKVFQEFADSEKKDMKKPAAAIKPSKKEKSQPPSTPMKATSKATPGTPMKDNTKKTPSTPKTKDTTKTVKKTAAKAKGKPKAKAKGKAKAKAKGKVFKRPAAGSSSKTKEEEAAEEEEEEAMEEDELLSQDCFEVEPSTKDRSKWNKFKKLLDQGSLPEFIMKAYEDANKLKTGKEKAIRQIVNNVLDRDPKTGSLIVNLENPQLKGFKVG